MFPSSIVAVHRPTDAMLRISVVKVESPSCLWCRVIQSPETPEHYNKLHRQMNLFYQDPPQDVHSLRPVSLEAGQVCVVYWETMKSWCRAAVESIIVDSFCCQACCLLVDHGERIVVHSEKIRVVMDNFLQLAFWVRKFHLAGIRPTTLAVPVFEEKAELKPSARWDSSATLYLHNLLRVSTQAEAVLLESESDSTAIELYLTIGDIKICVNEDLVVKKFAYYSRKSINCGRLEEGDRLPIMLPSSILTQTVSNKPTAQTQPLPDQQRLAAGPGDWLTAPFPPQNEQHKPVNLEGDCRSKLTEQQLSRSGSDTPTAAERDSSEDTDLSLATSLTENLHLFRFLKFQNPGTCYKKAAPSDEEALLPMSSGKTGAENLQSSQADEVASSSSQSVESAQAEEPQWSEEDWACSCFLEWLNPEHRNPDPDTEDSVVSPVDPRTSGILVHSAFPVEPWSSLDNAPIADPLRWVLRQKQYSALTPADCYSWPSVARGCNTIIISNSADQPLSYLSPLLSHILFSSIFTSHTSSSGPIAVLLCSGWKKAQAVYELLEECKVSQSLHPTMMLLGIGKDEAKNVKIPKNCLLLISTPFSLVRLLSCHYFLFLRLYHLVLDEADQLFILAPDEMATILQHFQKVTSSEENASCPQQLVAIAKRWTSHMEGLLASYMPCPSIVITIPEEAAVYGNIQQIILMTLENSKISVLLGALDYKPDIGQKTLIIVNSFQEVEDVFKAVMSRSVFCLKIHEGLTHELDFVIQQWKEDIGPGTHVILVTTNDCLKSLNIRDATCVIHYSFPSSLELFGIRLFCMVENFRNLSRQHSPQDHTQSCHQVTRSVLLISERNARHVIGFLRYLRRTNALLPPELLTFAQEVQVANEDQKLDLPLCSYLKSFGVCRDNGICSKRHRFISQLDQSELPASGVIDVIPLYIKTASVFYGRIIRKEDECFEKMASEMASYYADKKPGAKELLEGGLYAVQQDDVFHRVKILSVPDRSNHLFFSLLVRFIDVGKEEEVKSHQILQLPEEFHTLPGQAVEIIVCRVKPVDSETSWHPKVTRAISQKIRGLKHRARAILSLGNTVFVDPMVRVTQVPGMKTLINEYSVQREILNTGMGVSNPEHLDMLRELCEEDGSSKVVNHVSRPGDDWPSLEVRITAEEGVLVNTSRVAEVRKLEAPDLPHLQPMTSSGNQSLVPAPKAYLGPVCDQNSQSESEADFGQRNTDKKSAEHMESTGDGEVCSSTSHTAALNQGEKGVQEGADQSNSQQVISISGTDCDNVARSFHPQIRWCQTSNTVIVTVKLVNPENQCCNFYPDRVVYSGRVNGRSYRADLELYQKIAADICCWEMKSNEPVLKLVKRQLGVWEKLLRNKNIFVSYDVEYFEDEDEAPNGQRFLENTGEEENCYLNSESGTESDD